jgi:hypothetical protein
VAKRFAIPVAGLPATMAADVRATIPSNKGLAGAESIVNNLRTNYVRCHNAVLALQKWETTPPITVKTKVKGKTVTKHVKRQKPPFPADCPAPGSTATGTGGIS